MNFPNKLKQKLILRKNNLKLRRLQECANTKVDFYSNDYLGLAQSQLIYDKAHQYICENITQCNGATGSRLISGNSYLHEELEQKIKNTHQSAAALLFNSGFDANLGLFACIGQRHDVFLYDELVHASIHDGMRLSFAKAFAYEHNNLHELEQKLCQHSQDKDKICYVVTESVFSMDGDCPDLRQMLALCTKYNAYLIVDEAHAVGVFGYGLVDKLGIVNDVFATIITFGKALGCHGAVILSSQQLKEYLINYARSFIYTTAMPAHALATIKFAYAQLHSKENEELLNLIAYFKYTYKKLALEPFFIVSDSAIQSCIIPGEKRVLQCAQHLINKGYNVKAIIAPTVATKHERLRFCLHSFNSKKQIKSVLNHLLKIL